MSTAAPVPTPAADLATYVCSQSLLFTAGETVFVGDVEDNDINIVSFTDTGGEGDLKYSIDRFSVSVNIKHSSYQDGANWGKEIIRLVTGDPQTLQTNGVALNYDYIRNAGGLKYGNKINNFHFFYLRLSGRILVRLEDAGNRIYAGGN